MHQLSLTDAVMLSTETTRTPNHVCMVNIYDVTTAPNGAPTFDEILQRLEALLPLTPSLRHKLMRLPLDLDRPYWVDDPDFDIEFHVRHLALPRPGDWRQFRNQVARLHSRPIDLARPPWEITVVDGLESIPGLNPGTFATVMKVHHSSIDGQAGVQLLNVLHTFAADETPDLPPDDWTPEHTPTSGDLLRRAGVNVITNPVNAVRTVVANVSPLAREVVASRRRRTPSPSVERTRFQAKVSAHRTWDETRCTLADVKRIKNAVPGASVNDACISIVGQAMLTYLTEIGEPPTRPLVTLVPVSTRTPEEAKAGGNQVSGMRVSMRTDIADPLERIAAIHAETRTKKAAQNGVAMPVLLDVAEAVPGALVGAALRGVALLGARAAPTSNTIITNVPGSQVPMFLLGCQLVRSTGCVPLMDNVGLFHCVSSFNDDFIFMFTADRDLMPDPEPYLAHVKASLAAHIAAVADTPATEPAAARQSAKKAGGRTAAKKAATRPVAKKQQKKARPVSRKAAAARAPTKRASKKAPARPRATKQAAAGA